MPAVERTVKLATVVEELPAAWAFVMDALEEVGSDPQVIVSPLWSYGDDGETKRRFEVSVSGSVSEEPESAVEGIDGAVPSE